MDSKSKEVLVIIGNGFDLSLGLKTSYRQFFESEFWPFEKIKSVGPIGPFDVIKTVGSIMVKSKSLRNYLYLGMYRNWYNLELLLANYAIESKEEESNHIGDDLEYFSQLKHSLYKFIYNAEKAFLGKPDHDPNNKAARFLRAISKNLIPNIYTFNYTSLPQLAKAIGVQGLVCTHVHGSLRDQNIILGIEDNLKVPQGYDYLKKVSDPNYRSNNLYYDLMKAKDVIIYGHSLGENDFHFFRQFFKIHSDENNSDVSNKCNITIFTANSESRMDILAKLRNMNDGKNNQLFAQNNLQFVRTLDNDQEFEDWISKFPVHLI